MFMFMIFPAKSKHSSNMTPETDQTIYAQILPQFRAMAPQIVQAMGMYR